jgi:PilZ domain
MIVAYAELAQVNSFVSRSPRFGLDLPIRFFSSDGLAIGRCVDVSESGLLGDFDQPLNIWTTGEVTASVGEESVSIRARVARVDGNQAGLSFQVDSAADRLAVLRLIQFALRHGE